MYEKDAPAVAATHVANAMEDREDLLNENDCLDRLLIMKDKPFIQTEKAAVMKQKYKAIAKGLMSAVTESRKQR